MNRGLAIQKLIKSIIKQLSYIDIFFQQNYLQQVDY